ncbi:MAG: glycoside hydrolase family 127 protein [Clostridiales bacterium]|nr:glycoside hydrolase family 127 protein [Clostridiales bacterium]
MNKSKPVAFTNVHINEGFWQHRQRLNAEKTVHAVKNRFMDTGRFDAFQGNWREGMPNKPIFWWSSDIEKWIESVSYILMGEHRDKAEMYIPLCDQIIDLIEKNQSVDGYYQMWILQFEPTTRWNDRNRHELYCLGHLLEGAIAYYQATGKKKMLDCAIRMVDCVEKVFLQENSAAFITDGHPEIELALVKMYRFTGEKRYLDLSRFFIDQRGNNDKDKPILDWGTHRMDQSHLPVREQETAEGHAVRAGYLYSGMADVAYEDEDEALLNACRKLFDNINDKRMYITGGIGSTFRCEGFTVDYDLPNQTAYSETCASISLMMFAKRMLMLEPDSKYGDTFERVLYNGFLSGTSLTGDAFFYENPLEIDPKQTGKEKFAKDSTRMPAMQRATVFHTSCCPPNITRFIASLGDHIYSWNEDTLFIHQYIPNEACFDADGADIHAAISTLYPQDGLVKIKVGGGQKRLALRIPAWCQKYTITRSGKAAAYTLEKGYAYLDAWDEEIEINFDIQPYAVEASPHVLDDAGRIAIMRGPVLYCLEGVDNGCDLRDLHIRLDQPITAEESKEFILPVLKAEGWRRAAEKFDTLYRIYNPNDRKPQSLTFIPYYAFANRGVTEMVIWINP